MILAIDIDDKSFGDKILYGDFHLKVQDGEKIGLIGRNGTGKTTLLGIISGEDKDFAGEVLLRKGAVLVSSRQEHHGYDEQNVLEYILSDLPDYTKLKHIIDTYPEHMGTSHKKIQEYSDALERFGHLGYYEVEDDILRALATYQIDESKARVTLSQLSGGQKRLVELVKVQRARAHVALIDEPTNHMDYVAKEAFIKWLKSTRESVIAVTHDRDVLKAVDRIVEIRDGQAYPFKGNYDTYLKTNAVKMTSQVNEFGVTQRRISNLKDNIIRFRRLKEKSRDPGTISRFKSLEQKATKELSQLQAQEKPSFWIDRESAAGLNTKMSEAYEQHKTRNIRVRTKTKSESSDRKLIDVDNLALGYGSTPLFTDISFTLHEGERLRLHGRNGAGKSTIVNDIISTANDLQPNAKIFAGTILIEPKLLIGVYEQEISSEYMNLTLGASIEKALTNKGLPVNDQKVKQLLSDYLFNPATDADAPVARLSGGQKARLQLINMLAGDPQLLILDEPTNHLDLPSIEELEDALASYHGAVIYISHDSYFARRVGGKEINIKSAV